MTDPFMRVDVSQGSRDFQPVALEPGLPLLDRSNSNGQTLRKWLGSFVAEPARNGDHVGFYVRDDEGRRIDSVFCVPVSDKDLTGELAGDFKELQRRITAAAPQTPNEQLLHRIVGEQIRQLSDEAHAKDRRCSLFKFRDGKNKLHLVWSPGYRRRDAEPAAPLICTNPVCTHLFLQRRDTGAKCPVCQAVRKEVAVDTPVRGKKRSSSLLWLLLLALGGAYLYWQWNNPKPGHVNAQALLTVEPADWSGPIGSQVEFVITRHDHAHPEVVTNTAAVAISNPKVLSVKPYENIGKALSPGTTELTFFVDDLTAKAKIQVHLRTPPVKVVMEPNTLELGIGTTAQLKLIGEYEGGRKADLTDDAAWETPNDSRLFVHKGRVEGQEAGSGIVRARYQSHESLAPLEATAEINVRDIKYKDLKLSLQPNPLTLGTTARIHAAVTSESGTEFSVDESKELAIEAKPADKVTLSGMELTPVSEGDVQLTARFLGLTTSLDATIGKSDGKGRSLDVSPKTLDLRVVELARLNVLSAQPTSVQIKSMQPEIVEVTSDGRVIGRQVGSTELQVSDGSSTVKVPASVTAVVWQSISLEPPRMSLRTDESEGIRIFGVPEVRGVPGGGNAIEIAPDQVNWVQLPRPEFVDFDDESLDLTGVQPTGNNPEHITARINKLEASAEIEVVAAPTILTLSPEGSMEVPLGQKRKLTVQAQSGGAAVDVPADRIEWSMTPDSGFQIRDGYIYATKEDSQIHLSAKYQGATSNEIQVSAVAATPLSLTATASQSLLHVGDTGVISVAATGPGGDVLLNEEGLSFASSDSNVLTIDQASGAFRALSPGTTTVRVNHDSAKQPAEITLNVDPAVPEVVERPASLRLVSSRPDPIKLPVGAEFGDWKVEAVAADGSVTDVSTQAALVVGDDSPDDNPVTLLNPDANSESDEDVVAISDDRIVALKEGHATVQAVYGGIRTKTGLRFEVADALDVDEIRVTPTNLNLLAGESTYLSAEGFKDGKSVGDITSRPDLVWKATDETPIQVDGPHLTATKPGTSGVTASFGSVVSKPATVTVFKTDETGVTPAALGKLRVIPSHLKMKVGEVAHLGHEVVVRRQDTDFSDTCDVSAPQNGVVTFDSEERSLRAVSPGHSQVTFIVRDQSAVLDVDVEQADTAADAKSRIVVEPNTGKLAVGQKMKLRTYKVGPNGKRKAVKANYVSKSPGSATTTKGGVQGKAPGKTSVEAHVPGVNQPAKASFTVEDRDVQKLEFSPAQLDLAVGDRKPFKLYAVTSSGRFEVGNEPDLKFDVSDADRTKITLSAADRTVQALRPGQATVNATWKGKQASLPINTHFDYIDNLIIRPNATSIAEGSGVDYQVFAQRTGRLQALTPDDGVELSVANPVVATNQDSSFRVQGLKAGKTQVTAQYGSQRAVAQLTVAPRSTPPGPLARPTHLRFVNNPMSLDLADPVKSVHVVKVMSDGTEQNVDSLVKLTVRDPQDVVQVDQAAAGPVIRPKKEGQTQIDASLDDLQSQTPLVVQVAPRTPRQPELRVYPSTMHLRVGETKRFVQGEVLPASGGDPIAVPIQVTANPSKYIEVRPDGSIRGLATGNAVVTIAANDPEGKYSGVVTSANVEVGDLRDGVTTVRPPSVGAARRRELILTGPSETNVGADAQMHVESVVNGQSSNVTDRAQLVLVAGDEALAETRPGSVLRAKAPGRIQVQACLDDMTSAPVEMQIRSLAKFSRLELEIARNRMTVGEQRPYKLWGYPRGGGARQDLTRLVANDGSNPEFPTLQLQTLEPSADAQVVQRGAGSLTGRLPGRFTVQARLGDDLKSEQITLDVTTGSPAVHRIEVQPRRLDLRVGEETPAIKVLVATAGDKNLRSIDPAQAQISSSDPGVLRMKEPGVFSALNPGQAQLKVIYQGLEESIPVNVKINPFASIEISSDPKFDESALTVDLTVTANTAGADLEYRTTLPGTRSGADDETKWIRADKNGNQSTVKLASPRIPLVKSQNFYSVMLEARNVKTGEIEKHPFQFRLVSTSSRKSN